MYSCLSSNNRDINLLISFQLIGHYTEAPEGLKGESVSTVSFTIATVSSGHNSTDNGDGGGGGFPALPPEVNQVIEAI